MKQSNLKHQPKARTPLLKPLQKRQVSFGVILKKGLWLYGFAARIVNRFRHTDKPLNENIKRYEPRKRLTFNLNRRHKISAAVLSLGIIAVVIFFQFAPEKVRRVEYLNHLRYN